MFRAISCSSLGGQIVLIQHPVSPLLVSDCPVHLCMDEKDIDRNMYMERIVINV